MAAVAPRRSRSTRARWAVLLGLSVLFHGLVLGGLSLGWPAATRGQAEAPTMAVTLIDPPPFVRTSPSPAATVPRPSALRAVIVADTPPRYAGPPAKAATGEARDAVDLFGPVFADGLWPRPVLVRSEPCDPKDDQDRTDACRRDVMLIGLASEAAAGANARP